MSSGSLKDLVKSIQNLVPTTTLPLPDSLVEVIQAYLDKHLPIEDGDSQRLHDELLSIWKKLPRNKPESYTVFIAVLRELRPAIRGIGRWLQWWDALVIPVLGHIGEGRGLEKATRQLLMTILVFEVDDGDTARIEAARHTSVVISEKVLEMWLKQSRVATAEANPEAHYLSERIKVVLIAFGQKRPQEFLTTIDKYFVKREHRTQVLSLLCEFIRHSPPHLHLLLHTPLFDNLLRCLQIDTSTTVIALAMTALTMFLPHIPVTSGKHLPSLFNIFTRMLFWERERALSPSLRLHSKERNDDPDASEMEKEEKPPWEKLSYSFESDDETLPELIHYFTFLYGLYPINLMSYIRKPSRYLRHANFPGADDIDVEPSEIRKRTEPLRQMHLLHPNFFTLTIESELTDAQRWMRSAASDVVTFCMSLRVPVFPGSGNAPPMPRLSSQASRDNNRDIPSQTLLARKDSEEAFQSHRLSADATSFIWRTSSFVSPDGPAELNALVRLSSRASQSISSEVHSPTSHAQDTRSDSPQLAHHATSPLQDMLNSQQSLHRNLQQSLPNESSTTLSSMANIDSAANVDTYLQSLAQLPPRSPSLRPSGGENTNIAYLLREITLLKNDLNFERYLKQQHLSHIGKLRRNQVREAAVEAETQNLINANKILKGKLEEAKNLTLQTKKESEKSRSQSRKWEQDLATKLRGMREEQKKWTLESEYLRRDLEETKKNCEQLKDLVISSEAREMESSQKLKAIKVELEELEKLHADVDRLKEQLRKYQSQESEIACLKAKEEIASTKIELLHMQISARDEELQKTRSANAKEIEDLRAQLQSITQDAQSKATRNFQSMLDSALASLRARLAESQKAHAHLLRRFTSLQQQHLLLQEQQDFAGPLLGDPEGADSSEGGHSPKEYRRDPYRAPRGSEERPKLDYRVPSEGGRRNIFRSLSQDNLMNTPTRAGPGRSEMRTASVGYVNLRPPSAGGRPSSAAGSLDAGMGMGMSARTEHTLEVGSKSRIKPQSEARVYGRGGVQNIGKPDKGKEKEKEKRADAEMEAGPPSPTQTKKEKRVGGIRGLRGFGSG